MFIEPDENLDIAYRLWNKKPSGRLIWSFDPGRPSEDLVQKSGYNGLADLLQKELGCLIWGTCASPFTIKCNHIRVRTNKEDNVVRREYISDAGSLTELIKDGQIVKHRVTSRNELEILMDNWRQTRIEPAEEKFFAIKKKDQGRWPILVSTRLASPVQHIVQYETGLEAFWCIMADWPALLEEAMGLWQESLRRMYEIMSSLPSDGFYQAENTSTTMISPSYYRQYSLGQVSEFVNHAHRAGKRALVHMCGLIHDLMPLIAQTRMDGIHALSPPPIGDTDFEHAYDSMNDDCFIMGRFGSLEWMGKYKDEILANLKRTLPHSIYQEKAFALLVTADGAEVTSDNLRLVRDCINGYEQE